MDYRIVEKKALEFIVKAIEITEETSGKDMPVFWKENIDIKINNKNSAKFAIFQEPKEGSTVYTYSIGWEKEDVDIIPEGYEVLSIPTNTWAIFKVVGRVSDAFNEMLNEIHDKWLKETNYEMISSYDIEHYPEGNIKSDNYESELWIPIKS